MSTAALNHRRTRSAQRIVNRVSNDSLGSQSQASSSRGSSADDADDNRPLTPSFSGRDPYRHLRTESHQGGFDFDPFTQAPLAKQPVVKEEQLQQPEQQQLKLNQLHNALAELYFDRRKSRVVLLPARAELSSPSNYFSPDNSIRGSNRNAILVDLDHDELSRAAVAYPQAEVIPTPQSRTSSALERTSSTGSVKSTKTHTLSRSSSTIFHVKDIDSKPLATITRHDIGFTVRDL